MDRESIKSKALAMRDVKDLHRLLNLVKRGLLGEKAHPFRLKTITYYCNPSCAGRQRYVHFTIPKKSGGERNISAPILGLKSMLTALNGVFQSVYEPPKCVKGFVPKCSVVDNAQIHIGQNYIYNIDLQDFFTSIDRSRVWKRLTLPPFNYPSQLADIIAGLCSMRIEGDNGDVRYVLPQGAPTSPILTNIICEKLDRQLTGLAKRFGAKYSRYADDITFSSMQYIYAADGEFICELHRIIANNHFTINVAKTRLQKVGGHQEVTGLVVSEKVNVARQYTREIRTLLHIWERYGHLAACESYMRERKQKPLYRHKGGMPSMESVLMGKLQYLKMVKGSGDSTYKALNERFLKLTKKPESCVRYDSMFSLPSITYYHSMRLDEFEKLFSTTIKFRPDAEPRLFFIKENTERPITISRRVPVHNLFDGSEDSVKLRRRYRISLCDNGVSMFYMLHRRRVDHKYIKPKEYVTVEQFKAILEQHIKEIKQLTAGFIFENDDVEESYPTVTLEDIESGRIKIDKAEEILALAKELGAIEIHEDTPF